MLRKYPVYKGLRRPLIYKGLKGKFIAWGVTSLVTGLVLGGLLSTMVNMYLGGFVALAATAAGLAFTISRQKGGLHSKTRFPGIFIHPNRLKIVYVNKQKNNL
ncbi:hypothetical protein HDC92_004342 [Pedobacter sp. AK017]|uniref:DUF4133 domain-containing protein n=1 Tax=Pedobacter sp. AK017 TaxID=2723073 RepID=UPI001612DE0C|nr:DUF4133 domain-containing protein [Pedobacter sp. AK017]MBB5440639.1 hypothetical protein [Pedobacter sp. AK017]